MEKKFANLVYAHLKSIPKGRVSTYGRVAAAIGYPKAGRAVGNALNSNPLAPEIPCHRIVKSDGSLGGYRWGTKKKYAILKSEGIEIINNKIVDFKKVLI